MSFAEEKEKNFMDAVNTWMLHLVEWLNHYLWDFILLFLLCGTGIYFTIRLRFVQVTRFRDCFKGVFGSIKKSGQKGEGGISSFQSLMTAIAAQVGTGNLAGAASAIVSGGPGAIFWMWLSAFFGMATIFAEATLSQQHRKEADGQVTGGPVYYIRYAFQGRFGKILAGIFAVLVVCALGFMGNMVQSNAIGNAFNTAFNIHPLITGLIAGAIALFIFRGGLHRIVAVTEKLVPFMAILYIGGSLVVLGMNFSHLGEAFRQIFVGAFNPQAVVGGVVGISVRESIRYGVARGLFSNEAGMGSTPHAHAVAKVKHPCDQGIVAMMGVFIDTFIILTLTALVLISSGIGGYGEGAVTGIEFTQAAFSHSLGGFGNIFVAVCLLFFAFSTIIGWYFFGEANIKYLFGQKAVKFYAVIVAVFIVLGSVMKVDLVWELSDCFNGLMVIPNLIGLLALSPAVVKAYQSYLENKQREK